MFKKKVVIHNRELVFDSFFRIERTTLQFQQFNGSMSNIIKRLKFIRADSVAILLFNEDSQKVILANQFRYPTFDEGENESGWISEIVAGGIDKGETPVEACRREVLEETGYKLLDLTFISKFYVSPGGSSEQIFLFFANVKDRYKIGAGGGSKKENENIKHIEIPIIEVFVKLRNGKFIDAKTIISLYWLQSNIKNL